MVIFAPNKVHLWLKHVTTSSKLPRKRRVSPIFMRIIPIGTEKKGTPRINASPSASWTLTATAYTTDTTLRSWQPLRLARMPKNPMAAALLQAFFKSWMQRQPKGDSLLFDITSVSTYGTSNLYAERGYNRDGEDLEQVNLALLSSVSCGLPLWYCVTPGSMADVAVIEYVMKMLRKLEVKRFTFFGDRGFYSNALYVVFQLMGFYVEVERATSDGRMDMIVKTSDYIYILEFKLDKTADEALQQINDKEYAKPFEHDSRHIYKIGVNFSTKTRRIDGRKIAE